MAQLVNYHGESGETDKRKYDRHKWLPEEIRAEAQEPPLQESCLRVFLGNQRICSEK
jgi:hypothetical protein